ncbi:MAG: SpoIIE family protein phosphatase [Bacteroidetes bacterium]|nr:SpoIIE family protein phosphatase [Bacteroidota bacterium]
MNEDSLLHILNSSASDTTRANVLLSLSRIFRETDSIKARSYAERGLELARKTGRKDQEASAIFVLADVRNNASDMKTAIPLYLESASLYKEANSQVKYFRTLRLLGTCYANIGDFENAYKYLGLARDGFEKLNDYDQLKVVLNKLTAAYYAEKDYQRVKTITEESLERAIANSDSSILTALYGNLGLAFIELNEYDSSAFYLNKSVAIDIATSDSLSLAGDYLNIGFLYSRKNDIDNALKYYEASYSIFHEHHSLEDECTLLNNIGNIYFRKKDFRTAIDHSFRSYSIALSLELPDDEKEAAQDLAKEYAAIGGFDSAYKYSTIWSTLKDSLFNIEKVDAIESVQTRFDVDKKKRENELLSKKLQVTQLAGEKQKIYTYSMIGIATLILIVAFLSLRGYRQKKKANGLLEEKNKLIHSQKLEVERQKDILDEKQKEIVDSITYAKRIQGALLASDSLLKKNLPDHFVFYKPKDIVSGDFYWANLTPAGKFLLLTGDCTGHGVPGAFMSLLNITLLNEIVNEHRITQPDDILNEVRSDIISALNPDGSNITSWDGMDCSICSFDFRNNKMSFSSAFNPILIIRNGETIEFPADKQPVGFFDKEVKPFTLQKEDLNPGDMVYTFTDGFADQFGGGKGKKYKFSRMKEMLGAISKLPMNEQKKKLEEEFNSWKGDLFQVDDVLVIGIKV